MVLWIRLPDLVEWGFERTSKWFGATHSNLVVESVSPWETTIKDIEMVMPEANFSIGGLGLRYDPTELGYGRLHALSVSDPRFEIDLIKAKARFADDENDSEDDSTLQEKVVEFLDNPPLNFLRLRRGNLLLSDGRKSTGGGLALEGDLHPDIGQLRMDGNWSGLPWSSEMTAVMEGEDLFLSARAQLPDLSNLFDFVQSLPTLPDDPLGELNDFVSLEKGRASLRWTGRVDEDGLIDQFVEFNASEVLLKVLGFTVDIPRSILFLTPRETGSWESNFYANANWGDNLMVNGLNLRVRMDQGSLSLNGRVRAMATTGILPETELVGLSVDSVDLSTDENGAITGVHRGEARFSALHLESGLANLYDGKIVFEWLGEDRFQIELIKANASLPTMGINFQNLSYSGEISFEDLPKLSSDQTLRVREIFIGEDQKIEDFSISFSMDSAHRVEVASIEFELDGIDFSMDPANLIIESSEKGDGSLTVMLDRSQVVSSALEDLHLANLVANLQFNSLDPIETNGTQTLTFDLRAADHELKNGRIEFGLLPTGEKIIEQARIEIFGGEILLDRVVIEDLLEDLQLKVRAQNLVSQQILDSFDDLDADMDGNLSGLVTLRKLAESEWDFFGGSLALDPSEYAHLSLELNGMLTEGLDPKGAEYDNMLLLEKALANLGLDDLKVNFKVLENGERVVEMNVAGESTVDGKKISVEYRPRIIGGLGALVQQLNFSKLGSSKSK